MKAEQNKQCAKKKKTALSEIVDKKTRTTKILVGVRSVINHNYIQSHNFKFQNSIIHASAIFCIFFVIIDFGVFTPLVFFFDFLSRFF